MDEDAVSKSEFKAKALEYFRRVEASGKRIIVTDRGVPTLEVRPYRSGDDRKPLDVLRGSVLRYEGATEPVAQGAWEAGR
jgi:antitoxin (DNA-binding transcriptional repressor) of toxin-antitoxin stability system